MVFFMIFIEIRLQCQDYIYWGRSSRSNEGIS